MTSTQKQPKPSVFGPPHLPSTAPTPSISKPPSKRTTDSQKLVQTTSNKKPQAMNESGWDMMHDTLPEGDPVAEAMEEEQAAGLPEELASSEPTEEDVAAESAAQGYQWPYGTYYPPFGYPPPPSWGYQPWNQDLPAGSAASGPDFPPFPPPHPGLPYPPPLMDTILLVPQQLVLHMPDPLQSQLMQSLVPQGWHEHLAQYVRMFA